MRLTSPGGDGAIVAGGNTATVLGDLADAMNTNNNPLVVASHLAGYNGATWDRILSEGNDRDAIAEAGLGYLQAAVLGHAYNGAAWDRLRSEGNDRDAIAVATLGKLEALGYGHLFNGTSWDRQRALGSAALEGRGQASVSAAVPGAGPLTALFTNANPGTARATLITPTGGKRIRVVGVIWSARVSTASTDAELYFGTGAAITTTPAKAISTFTSHTSGAYSNSDNHPDGAGPVGAVDDVVSHRRTAASGDSINMIIFYREE